MRELHSIVCVKITPKPEEIRVDPESRFLVRTNARSEINPPDMNALEMALALKDRLGGHISILSMGPPLFVPYLRAGLAMGADHIYLLSDRRFAGADTLATTYTLAQGITKIGRFNLVFCGEESSDGATGQVPPGLAEWLDCCQLTLVNRLEVNLGAGVAHGRRGIKGGFEILAAPLPCVVSVKTAANEPRFMDFRIRPWAFEAKQLTVWDQDDLQADEQMIGFTGSPTVVSGLTQAESRERKRRFLTGSTKDITDQLAKILQTTI